MDEFCPETLNDTPSQWLFTNDELLRTPSILDGLPVQKERENRAKGVSFILQAGIMLKLPQITLATAAVFLHRFYTRNSMQETPGRPGHHHYSTAATSLFLATKVEENCRKIKELVIACVRVAQKDPYKVVDEQDKEYWRWRDVILLGEDVLLEALCFDLTIEPPYKILHEMMSALKQVDNKVLRNAAWAFINDSCVTVLCLLYPSRTIASSALYAAARHSQTQLSDIDGKAWWQAFGEDIRTLCEACNFMADTYQSKNAKSGATHPLYTKVSHSEPVQLASSDNAMEGKEPPARKQSSLMNPGHNDRSSRSMTENSSSQPDDEDRRKRPRLNPGDRDTPARSNGTTRDVGAKPELPTPSSAADVKRPPAHDSQNGTLASQEKPNNTVSQKKALTHDDGHVSEEGEVDE